MTYETVSPAELMRITPYAVVRYIDGRPGWIVSTHTTETIAEMELIDLMYAPRNVHKDFRIVRIEGVEVVE